MSFKKGLFKLILFEKKILGFNNIFYLVQSLFINRFKDKVISFKESLFKLILFGLKILKLKYQKQQQDKIDSKLI